MNIVEVRPQAPKKDVSWLWCDVMSVLGIPGEAVKMHLYLVWMFI